MKEFCDQGGVTSSFWAVAADIAPHSWLPCKEVSGICSCNVTVFPYSNISAILLVISLE